MNEEEKKESPQSNDDNQQQEPQLNTHSKDEPIVPAETTEVEQPITYNSQPATKQDMEVHHHSHESHGKKNWKSYFWEFLMLFLAITLGFLVENQREHYIEHLRAKEFAKSLVQDLHNDTTEIDMQKKRTGIYWHYR